MNGWMHGWICEMMSWMQHVNVKQCVSLLFSHKLSVLIPTLKVNRLLHEKLPTFSKVILVKCICHNIILERDNCKDYTLQLNYLNYGMSFSLKFCLWVFGWHVEEKPYKRRGLISLWGPSQVQAKLHEATSFKGYLATFSNEFESIAMQQEWLWAYLKPVTSNECQTLQLMRVRQKQTSVRQLLLMESLAQKQ